MVYKCESRPGECGCRDPTKAGTRTRDFCDHARPAVMVRLKRYLTVSRMCLEVGP
jgi:hypothetical protein